MEQRKGDLTADRYLVCALAYLLSPTWVIEQSVGSDWQDDLGQLCAPQQKKASMHSYRIEAPPRRLIAAVMMGRVVWLGRGYGIRALQLRDSAGLLPGKRQVTGLHP